jgi:hypothetical protein
MRIHCFHFQIELERIYSLKFGEFQDYSTMPIFITDLELCLFNSVQLTKDAETEM